MNLVRAFLLFFLLFAFTCSGVSLAEEDPYLKALEAEVGGDSVASDNNSQLADQPVVVEKQIPQRKEFEKRLLDDRPATFHQFYVKLSEEEKVNVIEAYFSADKDMEKANRLIFDLYYK